MRKVAYDGETNREGMRYVGAIGAPSSALLSEPSPRDPISSTNPWSTRDDGRRGVVTPYLPPPSSTRITHHRIPVYSPSMWMARS